MKAKVLGTTFVLSFVLSTQLYADDNPITRTEFVMGTVANITVYEGNRGVEKAYKRLNQLDKLLSINKNDTLITDINNLSGLKPVKVPHDIFSLIETGIYYSNLTNGLFDITIEPLTNLWRIGFDDAMVPDDETILEALSHVDYSNVALNRSKSTVFLTQEGMGLDLGGIAKGYACDEVVKILKNSDVEEALIDIGGNVYILGDELVNVGLQNPFDKRGEVFATLNLSNKAVVTSGIYERFLEIDGTKYHHLINPKTGYPFDNNLASVTIISNYSTDGDALSTAVFAKGLQAGINFVEALNGVEAIFVTTDYEVYPTSGIADTLIITNELFTRGK
ncbi:MAG: hypothetical protein ATN33_02825 [Epulopiscium sp. Nele67-Bin001]|nr:MAG: hypothetical protein BEN18_09780 [Epulopiscium sp. Nuni2H_MBin001]OON90510.1 MAG: hypothetical protein ATN33_02825 [Epulopiscium sp. Nele67-Bin001]